MDLVVAILVFLGIVIVAVLFFGGWVIVAIVRLLARALGGGRTYAPPTPPLRLPAPPGRTICAQTNCRAPNVVAARFCRRCGRPMSAPLAARDRAVVRRVAMW